MPERWRTELRRIDRLYPDDDLVEEAMARPVPPGRVPSGRVKVATIALALLLPVAAIGAAIYIGGRGSTTPAADDGVPVRTNGELLYTKRLGASGWSLFALDPETGVERQITSGFRDYASDWSPDGTKIVYDSETPSGHDGIWVVSADGSDATKLIDGGSVPVWSPDGTKIAFARPDLDKTVSFGDSFSGTPFYLYVMDADGTDVQRLTDGQISDYSPVWSPDGSQIAFVRYGDGVSGLFVMSADGTDVRQVADPGTDIFGAPAWSPDGASIAMAFNGIDGGAPGGIILIPVDGTGGGTVIPGTEVEYPDYVSNPAWSPDGEWMAFVDGYPGELVIVHPDGSERRTLSVDPGSDSIEELSWGVAQTTSPPS